MYARVGTLYELGLVSIGEQIVKNAFREARMAVESTGWVRRHEAMESLAFVQGSGLEAVIRTYGLSYDATELRETFWRWTQTPK